MAFNLGSALENAKAKTNMNEEQAGGGEYEPPAAGVVNLRFAGYIEVGKQAVQFGKDKPIEIKDMTHLVWELSGPKHKPREGSDGKTFPIIMVQEMTNTLTAKSLLFKQFKAMNAAHGGKYTHIAEMIGLEFRGKVTHDPKVNNGKTYYNEKLVDIGKAERPEFKHNEETGEMEETGNMVPVKVDPMLSKPLGFLFHHSTKEHWDNLYIEGKYPERKNEKGEVVKAEQSKNKWQLMIQSAKNWNECPVYPLVKGGHTAEEAQQMADDLGTEPEPVTGREADNSDGIDV